MATLNAVPDAEPGRILVMEDDADIRSSIASVLGKEGYQVTTAVNGRDALDRLADAPQPDLVLLDLMMPVLNGFDFLAEIRTHPKWSFIPVIVVSANQGYEPADLKTFSMLRKPFDLDHLLEEVRRGVELSRSSPRR